MACSFGPAPDYPTKPRPDRRRRASLSEVRPHGPRLAADLPRQDRSRWALANRGVTAQRIAVCESANGRPKNEGQGAGPLKGLGTARDSSKVRHEFDGDFPYECTDTKLTVWSLGKDKRPLEFKRLEK